MPFPKAELLDNLEKSNDYTTLFTNKESRWWECGGCSRLIDDLEGSGAEHPDGLLLYKGYDRQNHFRPTANPAAYGDFSNVVFFQNPPWRVECMNTRCLGWSRARFDKYVSRTPHEENAYPANRRNFKEREFQCDRRVNKVDSYCLSDMCSSTVQPMDSANYEFLGINGGVWARKVSSRYDGRGNMNGLVCNRCSNRYGDGFWYFKLSG